MWESTLVPLPVTDEGTVILVPKIIVRHKVSYEYPAYYTHYLLPEMQDAEIQANTGLVELLKDGRKRVTKKALREKYGSNKLAVVEQTMKHPHVLDEYREDKEANPAPPLEHEQLSDIEDSDPPDWNSLIDRLRAMPVGRPDADAYENLIEQILSALFYPSLCSPTKQHKIHDGQKRIDITYTNEAKAGFFSWVSQHYPAAFIFVECKNYGKDVSNPEVDQLSGRFSPSRGQVGVLTCRSVSDRDALTKRCKHTATDQRGFILTLTDEDVIEMCEQAKLGVTSHQFPALMKQFRALIN